MNSYCEHIINSSAGHIRWRECTGKIAEITDIFIRPEQRRQGEGTKLIEQVVSLARDAGLKRVYLFSRIGNGSAHEFYEAVGFTLAAALDDFYPDGDAVLFMRII